MGMSGWGPAWARWAMLRSGAERSGNPMEHIPCDKKLPVLFNFSHDYYKLRRPFFTTIRSIKYKAEPGQIGWITLKIKALFLGKIMAYNDMRICDIPLELLKDDAEYPGFSINSHEDFVELLNSFLPYKSNRLTTIKRIFFIRRV